MARIVNETVTYTTTHTVEKTTISEKDKTLAFIIGLIFGALGGHYFYVERNGMGVLYLCAGGLVITSWIKGMGVLSLFIAGLFFVSWFIDLVKILAGNFYDHEKCYLRQDEMTEEKLKLASFTGSWKSLSSFSRIALSAGCGIFAVAVIVSGAMSEGKSRGNDYSGYSSGSLTKSSTAEKKTEEKSIPTMFYNTGVRIKQQGSVLNLEIPFKDGKSSWPLKHPVEGMLKVKLNWSGAGVPDNKRSSISYQVKEKDFDCGGVYCKAKLILDIPGAYTGAAWLNIDMSFKPENGESFRMTERIIVLGL